MSGIYIKGMEMPKDGSFEVLVVHDNGIVTKGFFPIENEYTKAIFIPDHGRLIDADAMKTRIEGSDYHTIAVVKQWVDDQPTIIESEGE